MIILERGADDFGIQFKVWFQSKLPGAALQVGLNFRLADKAGTPVRIGRIGKAVGVRPNIAGQPRVGMNMPGTPSGPLCLKDGEIGKAVDLRI